MRRLATHGKKVFHSPINTDSRKAYSVAEMGTIGLVPDRNCVKDWLSILRAADLQKADIIVLDPFCVAAWSDARPDVDMVGQNPT